MNGGIGCRNNQILVYRSGTRAPVAVGSSRAVIDFENIHARAISVALKDSSRGVNTRSPRNTLNADLKHFYFSQNCPGKENLSFIVALLRIYS